MEHCRWPASKSGRRDGWTATFVVEESFAQDDAVVAEPVAGGLPRGGRGRNRRRWPWARGSVQPSHGRDGTYSAT